jgi:DNA-binding NarL/FixJ family response regulator
MSEPPIRVLVCDDQALIRTGYVTIFSAQPDLEVVGEAADGRTAVASAARLRPDVVVMDIKMPGLDGIEATRQLAGPGTEPPVKVLVVTTFNLDEYVYQALRAGASGFLLKDSPPADLVNGVRTVAAGESLLAPAVTRQLVGRFAARIRPTDPDAPGNGEDVRVPDPDQAGPAGPGPGGRAGLPHRAGGYLIVQVLPPPSRPARSPSPCLLRASASWSAIRES